MEATRFSQPRSGDGLPNAESGETVRIPKAAPLDVTSKWAAVAAERGREAVSRREGQ